MYPVRGRDETGEGLMAKLIVVVVAAFFALAFPASAYALESGAT